MNSMPVMMTPKMNGPRKPKRLSKAPAIGGPTKNLWAGKVSLNKTFENSCCLTQETFQSWPVQFALSQELPSALPYRKTCGAGLLPTIASGTVSQLL